MNLAQLKHALSQIRNDCEISVRYVDTLGTAQTVPIARVVEEILHSVDQKPVRRVILVVN